MTDNVTRLPTQEEEERRFLRRTHHIKINGNPLRKMPNAVSPEAEVLRRVRATCSPAASAVAGRGI